MPFIPNLNPPPVFSHEVTVKHKGTRRKKQYPSLPNEKLLEVQKPFLEKVSGRRRQKLAVDLANLLTFFLIFINILS
jgi:hypothetical protein